MRVYEVYLWSRILFCRANHKSPMIPKSVKYNTIPTFIIAKQHVLLLQFFPLNLNFSFEKEGQMQMQVSQNH